MKNNILKIGSGILFFSLCFLLLMTSCKHDSGNNENDGKDTVATFHSDTIKNNGFYDIPPPIQQVQLLQKAGAKYDKGVLNPLENSSKYIQVNSKALNLGVYGADLSYAAVFNQPQDVILYLMASQKLAEELSIKGDFNTEIMQRLGKSSNNKDSLLMIVSDVYRKSNEALKENDQSHLSALVITGSFIEAMYVATEVAKNVKDKQAIYNRIGEFKGSLNNLVALLTTAYDNDFSNVLPDLKRIKAIYDENSGTDLTEQQITNITKEIKAIRIKITNM